MDTNHDVLADYIVNKLNNDSNRYDFMEQFSGVEMAFYNSDYQPVDHMWTMDNNPLDRKAYWGGLVKSDITSPMIFNQHNGTTRVRQCGRHLFKGYYRISNTTFTRCSAKSSIYLTLQISTTFELESEPTYDENQVQFVHNNTVPTGKYILEKGFISMLTFPGHVADAFFLQNYASRTDATNGLFQPSSVVVASKYRGKTSKEYADDSKMFADISQKSEQRIKQNSDELIRKMNQTNVDMNTSVQVVKDAAFTISSNTRLVEEYTNQSKIHSTQAQSSALEVFRASTNISQKLEQCIVNNIESQIARVNSERHMISAQCSATKSKEKYILTNNIEVRMNSVHEDIQRIRLYILEKEKNCQKISDQIMSNMGYYKNMEILCLVLVVMLIMLMFCRSTYLRGR
jgi:hypothetical protein